jgi:hypothetical protein
MSSVTNTRINLASINYNPKQEEKVGALSPKAKAHPLLAWVKPAAYTTLTVAGLAAIYFVGSAISSSLTLDPTPDTQANSDAIQLFTSYTTGNPSRLDTGSSDSSLPYLSKITGINGSSSPTLGPTPDTQANSDAIQLFTSYTTGNPSRLEMSRKVRDNHIAYCQKHGYKYDVYEKNLADTGSSDSSLPYWSKIAGINRFLESGLRNGSSWIVWMDDDEVILDGKIRMEQWIQDHGGKDPNIHVIVTEDSQMELNTGVLIVRNSDVSRKFFKELWEMRHLPSSRNQAFSYSQCPAQSCCHEQEAMIDLLKTRPEYHEFVHIIPQTGADGIGINTFERFNHYDGDRSDPWTKKYPMHLQYNDPDKSRCKSGDFACQCTGLATNGQRQRADPFTNLRAECIDSLLARVQL